MLRNITIILLLLLFIPGCFEGADKIRLTPERAFVVEKEERDRLGGEYSYSTTEKSSSFSVELVE